MNVTFYSNFEKKINSTKRPSGSGTTLDCKMKSDCSMSSPVFLIDGIDLSYNYCYFNNRYYFINDIVLNKNNIYEIYCSVDVLATYKPYITSYNTFIERSASKFDPMIIDNALSSSQDIKSNAQATTQIKTTTGQVPLDPTSGCYLVKIFGKGNGPQVYVYDDLTTIGGLLSNSAFGLTDNALNNLLETGWMQILDVSAYVSNIMWLPFPSSIFTTVNDQIDIAYVHLVGVTANRVVNKYIGCSGTISVPTNDYNDFRKNHPSFSSYTMYLPGVGSVDVPAMEAANGLTYSLTIDIYTGACTYYLFSNDTTPAIIASFEGEIGVEIPYGVTSVTNPGLISNWVGAIAGTAQNNVQPLISGGLDVIQNLTSPTPKILSGKGSLGKIVSHPYIMVGLNNYESKEFPGSVLGRPLCEYETIGNLSGFVKCGAASLDIPGFDHEKETLNTYLNTGFYYE